MGRHKHPRAARLPVRFAVIDDQGRFRALVENYTDALACFANLNLDKLDKRRYQRDELEQCMIVSNWEVQTLTKPWEPVTDGRNLLWGSEEPPEDNPRLPGEENGFVIWLRQLFDGVNP